MSAKRLDYAKHVDGILAQYGGDNESAHADEDELLWTFVSLRAAKGDDDALALLRLRHTDRTRWYA